ncbi:transcriptional activator TipA [Planococcus antarcticus DSM 14505]|uniref:Transcriptional activator TipA n=1 Tax=Planococcus antarcticus DSM 14505 TaxID=1185653 RepID=A0A1C7DES8_9BACL|nr:MerR family transcriptional regulator [Planococcus antarcticus]ANU09948.1 transcriptional regulator [Planococcus antarcticus DSM 14505]EIM07457.1 transcriptional activator TipA [Planococcus antarcticus DSM 14505]
MYKVQEVAKIAGVSVRTLHHYDSIGLLKPSNIGTNRYRYYNGEDLKLLQQILFLKELDFSLKKIQELVADGFDREYALSQHIELLEQKKQRIENLIQNAERTQQELQGSQSVTDAERFSAFTSKKTADLFERYQKPEIDLPVLEPTSAQAETFHAAPRYGEESAIAVATAPVETALNKEPVEPEKEEEDLDEINREGDRIYNTVASLMDLPPQTETVQKEMKAYYTLLNRFYECSPRMFRGLGDLYASDSRFANNIDQHGQGLANYLKDAMYVYAEGLQDA